ncbi:MAG: LVIVD repeat-containing protein [Streptomyces sp.]|uniref:LVIVD repeat-containing protein n=1 Tax=Streptomyces sp. TaxID=1931 RepID=UPI003D6B5280
MRRLIVICAMAMGLLLLPAPALAHEGRGGDEPSATRGSTVAERGAGTEMSPVANLQYDSSGAAQSGSDIEFLKAGEREYALAGTLRKGMQIIDITEPAAPRIAAVYDCKVTQGDIQVWKNGTRVLASYTADGTFGASGADSRCARDLGLDANASGTVIVDLTKPTAPETVSFVPVPRGSHNMTIHPSGKYLYNSNSDLLTSTEPTITIYDVSVPKSPRKVQDFPIPYTPASLGSESHDITFNASGTRAYSAALSQTLVLDTTNPEQPKQIAKIVDPAVNVSHQSDPVTLTRADGSKRDILVVTDERAGAAGSAECPGGGLHVYDITGGLERSPKKLGAWFIPVVKPQDGTTCTSHVLRIYPDQKMLTIAWYGQGVRVLDISGLAEVTGSPATTAIGDGVGMREIGNYVFPDSDTWSFKTNRMAADGSFYGYGNDLTRGLDVYRFSGAGVSVPPLEPTDMTARGRDGAEASASGSHFGLGPVAASGLLAVPALLAVGSLRRRKRS